MSDLLNFEIDLEKIIGKSTKLRPFVCDGSPLECEAFIVGFNPATTMSKEFWEFWQAGHGFDKTAWSEAYMKDRQMQPLNPGKKRRNPVSNTRRVLNWVLESALPVRCLETNIYAAPSKRAKDLPREEQISDTFDFLLASIKPKVIVAHGHDAKNLIESHIKNMVLSIPIISVSHFSRGWSQAAAHDLGLKIKQACMNAQQGVAAERF